MICDEKECFLCGRTDAFHVHHVMNGVANRPLCDEDGLMIYLCHECHSKVHDNDAQLQRDLKAIAETHYLQDHTFEEWMKRYKRNYIEGIS